MSKNERCPGSLQLVMSDDRKPSRCPACGAVVAVVELDGRPVLVEHRRHDDEALSMSLFA